MNELVSVVVPIYNVESYLPHCLECLASQTYRNLEIILVDQDSSGFCKFRLLAYIADISEGKINPVTVLVLSKIGKTLCAVVIIGLSIVVIRHLHNKDIPEALHIIMVCGKLPDV